jgi:4-methyl-5(b-hydroxyethyl)-thiazole monophosphate biosynthesis
MRSVLIPLAEGFEELEAVSIIDVLRRAGIKVVVAGLRPGPLKGSRDTVLVPDAVLDDVLNSEFDMLVLPGGMPGVKNLGEDSRIKKLLDRYTQKDRYTGAICAAPSLLAAYGHLAGKSATSNPKFKDQVAIEGVRYREDAVVTDGNIVTSRGPGTSIAFALALVEKLVGKGKRDEVEAGLVIVH